MKIVPLLALGLLLACKKPPEIKKPEVGPLCFVETMTQWSSDEEVRALRPEAWFALLLRGYDLWTGAVPRPLKDCAGSEIRWKELQGECVENEPPAVPEPEHKLTKDDLVIAKGPGNMWLVWVMTDHLRNGEAVGPIALASFSHRGASVHALGVLRSKRRRARLRLEKVGPTPVLVAEGDCDRDDPSRCKSAMRVLPLRGDWFAPEPLTQAGGDDEGKCLGPAWLPTSRVETIGLESGWERRFEQTASLSFEGDAMTIHEQVVVNDADPRQPGVPPRLFRRADANRTIKVTDKRLVVSGPSLWSGMLRAAGALQKKKRAETETLERGNLPPVKVTPR